MGRLDAAGFIQLMITLILTLLFATEPTVLTCTVTGPTTIDCGKQSLESIDWNADYAHEWLLESSGPDAEPRKVVPVVGQKLKIELGSDGNWYALASCEVRIHRRVKAGRKPGEIPSFTLWEPPADCVTR